MTHVDATTATSTARVLEFIPAVLRVAAEEDGPFAGLVDATSALIEPRTAIAARGSALFEPMMAPESLLPYLASWLGYGALFVDPHDPRRHMDLHEGFPPGADRLRQFLVAWPQLHVLRGTTDGLRLVLEVATGQGPFRLTEDAEKRHVDVIAPPISKPQYGWLCRLIAMEIPVHITWSLRFKKSRESS